MPQVVAVRQFVIVHIAGVAVHFETLLELDQVVSIVAGMSCAEEVELVFVVHLLGDGE